MCLFDEKKKRKVESSWFDSRYDSLEAFFEISSCEYTIRFGGSCALLFETIQVKGDIQIYLLYKQSFEESNLILDVVSKKMEEKEKEEQEKNEQ
ncbi:MAG: hypothetical protein U9O20_00935 [Patescibacteria group bacterium]|nr:hypothetical protein [Patescibacteria group bacterium]